MKTNHYWALLKFGSVLILIPSIVIIPAVMPEFFLGAGDMNDPTLSLTLLATSGAISISFACGVVFQDRHFILSRLDQLYARPLEFSFSRAICRNSFYWTKVTLFGFTAMLPFLAFGLYSLLHPDRTVSFDQDIPGGDVTRAFYLEHFPGAVVQGSGQRSSIMLPHAQTELALIILCFGMVVAAAYQAILLGTLRLRWCQWLMPIIPMVASFALLAWSCPWDGPPSPLDQALVWTIQHLVPLFLGGIVIIGLALRFGCRRFVRQEVLS